MIDEELALMRAHRNNISRYRRLLGTELTEFERQYIERRMSEEKAAMAALAASSYPLPLQTPNGAAERATALTTASNHG